MLYAQFSAPRPAELEWHVGDPNTDQIHKLADCATMVQVDGHELEHVRKHQLVSQCPVGKRIVRFYGDEAKRIIGNL